MMESTAGQARPRVNLHWSVSVPVLAWGPLGWYPATFHWSAVLSQYRPAARGQLQPVTVLFWISQLDPRHYLVWSSPQVITLSHNLVIMRLRWTTLLSPLLALAGASSSSSQTSWSNLGLLSSQASKRSVEDSHVRLVSSVCSLQW